MVERSVDFLNGKFWPDEGRVDVGSGIDDDNENDHSSSSSSSSRFQGGNIYKPPTKAEIACKKVFNEESDWTSLEPNVDIRRRQGLFRESRLLDLLFILLRAGRIGGLSMHLLFLSPSWLKVSGKTICAYPIFVSLIFDSSYPSFVSHVFFTSFYDVQLLIFNPLSLSLVY